MKKGIERYSEYDESGRWMLVIEKKRGRLTLEEIREAAKDWESDFYLLALDCFHDEGDDEQFSFVGGAPDGDIARLYRTDLFYREGEH